MRRFRKSFILLFIIIILSSIVCDEDPPPEGHGVAVLPKIGSITFGTGWNASDSTVSDTGRFFSPTITKVYYQIKFDSMLVNWFSIKNVWTRGSDTLLSSVSIIPSGTTRLCGEFCKYNADTLGLGTYKLAVFYFDTTYTPARYGDTVNQTFTIQ